MSDILDELRSVEKLRGATFSSEEVIGFVCRAANEIELLREKLEFCRHTYELMRRGKSVGKAKVAKNEQ